MNSFNGTLEGHLTKKRSEGHKLLLPYVTGGYPVDNWVHLIDGFASAGADAMEIGIPFSDPVMDGPTVQEASSIALSNGSTPAYVLDQVATTDPGVPLVAMTYYNVAYHMGHERFASSLAAAGVSASILPDLPLEESNDWIKAAEASGIENVMLAAPTASQERLGRLCEATRGFIYGVGLVGVTGERAELAASATVIAGRLKSVTDKPVIIGVGVSSPEQAKQVCEVADGVVVASAIIRGMLDGGSVEQAIDFVGQLRSAID